MVMYRYEPLTGRTRILRSRDMVRRRAKFARTCEVWVRPEGDAVDGFGTFVCEVHPDGYAAYRISSVNPVTGAPHNDPGGFGVERVWWCPDFWSNIDHVRAEHEDMLRECGYVRVL